MASAAALAADRACPEALEKALRNHVPACTALGQGRLISRHGNRDVAFRLYRWISTRDAPRSSIYDAPPYSQGALTLTHADSPDAGPFWTTHAWLGMAWIEAPFMVVNERYGELLVVRVRYAGTGSFVEDHVFMPTMGRTWQPIESAQLDPETGRGWSTQLADYLPGDHYLAKGILVDYETLSGTSKVWKKDDANCCPSGGEIRFQLQLSGPDPRLSVARARYRPAP